MGHYLAWTGVILLWFSEQARGHRSGAFQNQNQNQPPALSQTPLLSTNQQCPQQLCLPFTKYSPFQE